MLIMKVFDLTIEEVKSIKNRQIFTIVLCAILWLIIEALLIIFSSRNLFFLFLLLMFLFAIIFGVYFLFIILVKLRNTNAYLLILRKANQSSLDKYFFKEKKDDIIIKDSLSYQKYLFEKDGQNYEFYFLSNAKISVNPEDFVEIKHIDNIALEVRTIHEKN